jgi:hypothetical protein
MIILREGASTRIFSSMPTWSQSGCPLPLYGKKIEQTWDQPKAIVVVMQKCSNVHIRARVVNRTVSRDMRNEGKKSRN